MRSRVWARKSLNTALGSWTELRHDTILYAKQSVTAEGGGGEEPCRRATWSPTRPSTPRSRELATTLRQGLTEYGSIDPESADKLETMIALAETLRSIAEKELAGEELTEEERSRSRVRSLLEGLEQFDGRRRGPDPLPDRGEEPVGRRRAHQLQSRNRLWRRPPAIPLVLYAAFEVDGKLQLFVGASYAYYEFTVPLAERLTDEEWIGLLDAGQAPRGRRGPTSGSWRGSGRRGNVARHRRLSPRVCPGPARSIRQVRDAGGTTPGPPPRPADPARRRGRPRRSPVSSYPSSAAETLSTPTTDRHHVSPA